MSKEHEYDVCVIGGCGHVGLPLALCFAKEKKKVVSFDVNKESVAKVQSGKMPFKEKGGDELLSQTLASKHFSVTDDPQVISKSQNIIFILGTPVSSHLYPDYNSFFGVIEKYIDYLREDQLFILRSTVYPGCSEKVHQMFLDHNLKIDVAYCPERIAEGYAVEETYSLPHIVSGFTDKAVQRAKDLFSVFKSEIVELAPMEAELTKLFTNVWRYIKFSIPNQFMMIANNHGLDFYKIYEAMTHQYPRTKDFPKAGLTAGPCLFKDTMQLAAFSDNSLFLGHSAMLINEGMPTYVTKRMRKKYDLKEKTVGILGLAFKGESDDGRESLAYKLYNILSKDCKRVLITDPYVNDDRIESLEKVCKESDILVLAAPHEQYKKVDISKTEMIDIWDFYGQGVVI